MSKKLKKLRIHPRFYAVVSAVALVATIGAVSVRAALTPREEVIQEAARQLNEQEFGGVLELSPPEDEVFGVAASQSAIQPLGRSRVTTKQCYSAGEDQTCIEEWTLSGTIGTASSTFMSLPNTHVGEVILKRAYIWLDGAPTTTVHFSMGTSTSAVAPDYNAPDGSVPRGIFNRFAVPTSTDVGIIDSTFSVMQMLNSTGQMLSASSTVWRIKSGQYLVGSMTSYDSDAIYGNSVTSSARGFSDQSRWVLELMRISTSTIQ